MTNSKIIKRLYTEYTKKFLPKILVSVFFSLIVATSTASIAWLLDPAIKKIFIDKDQTLIYVIPFAIILAFSLKGTSLYFAKIILRNKNNYLRNYLSHSMRVFCLLFYHQLSHLILS